MKVGSAQGIGEIDPKELRRKTGLTGGPGPGNGRRGGGGNGGDGGNDPDDFDNRPGAAPFTQQKARILMWFLLLIVTMTFGGLIAAYVVIATNGVAEWRPFSLPLPVWISTALILISSFTLAMAIRAVNAEDQPRAKKWFLATTVLGAAFVSSQMLAWFELTRRGLYMTGNPYAGFFYILTAVHAVHVLGGIIALSSVLLNSWYPIQTEKRWLRVKTIGEVVGWYWHFLGGLWVVLFVLLGFWT